MMYVRYKFREPSGLVNPKGPNFFHAKTISCEIDGTTLIFKAPKHRPQFKNQKPLLPARHFKMDEMNFHSKYNEFNNVSDNWENFDLYQSSWAFNGPWFTGTQAELRMYCTLVKPVNYENRGGSLFHPQVFENILTDYLTNLFSRFIDKDTDKHLFIGPVDWQPLTQLPVVAVRLLMMSDDTITISTIRHYVFFPITDQVMACINFIPSQLAHGSQEELDKRVSRTPMY